MKDIEIENLIISSINNIVFKYYQNNLSYIYSLSNNTSMLDSEGFACQFDNKNLEWKLKNVKWIDPLSCVLQSKTPMPYLDEDYHVASITLAKYFGRPLDWITSFQNAWQGKSNDGSSIFAHLLGSKLRNKYLK